jgi:PadR family transcriptional regulator PadR
MRERLGELEHMVLLAVLRLSGDAYGVNIRKEIRQRTGRSITAGTIYPTLDRLERKGMIVSEASEPVAERGGRSRRVCAITPAGVRALREAHRVLRAMSSGFEKVLSEGTRR